MATAPAIERTIISKAYPFLQAGQDIAVSVDEKGIHIAISGEKNSTVEFINILIITRNEVAPGVPLTIKIEGEYNHTIS